MGHAGSAGSAATGLGKALHGMSREDLVYGRHAVTELLASHPERIVALWVQDKHRGDDNHRLLELAHGAGISVQTIARQRLDRLVDGARHQGVVARYKSPKRQPAADLDTILGATAEPPLLLVLDGVQDPHNLGACLRSADGAGAQALVIPRNRAVGVTPAVRKVASGAAESVPVVQVGNLARTLRDLRARGLRIIGAAGDAELSVYEADLTGPVALVLGAEQRGLRRLTREHCDLLVRIPMMGRVQSLNVSVSGAVLLYEVRRRRSQGGH